MPLLSTRGAASAKGFGFTAGLGLGAPYTIDFLIIAGGGGVSDATDRGTGGGAGGYRNSYSTEPSGGNSPSEASATIYKNGAYVVTVGAGGTGNNTGPADAFGVDSSLSGDLLTTITSIGGASGRGYPGNGLAGGSGSGGGLAASFAPNVSPSTGGAGTAGQGSDGGQGNTNFTSFGAAGGGGGAGAVGGNASGGGSGGGFGGPGGNGLASSITGTSVTRAGGGGGGGDTANTNSGGTGGSGGGGNGGGGGPPGASTVTNGTANTGSGGGGCGTNNSTNGNGGKGVVIIRMPTSSYSGVTTGSPTVTTDGSDTILVFNDSGTFRG
jgi:hypothetical protein